MTLQAHVDPASSTENESNTLVLDAGPVLGPVVVKQIAGLIARRIVCDLKEGEGVRQGQRVGMIRFGSRVDVFLPPDAQLRVSVGDRVRAGETVVGVLP